MEDDRKFSIFFKQITEMYQCKITGKNNNNLLISYYKIPAKYLYEKFCDIIEN